MGCVESKKVVENVSSSDIKTVCHLEDVFGDEKCRSEGLSETEVKCELRVDDGNNLAEKIKLERLNKSNKFKTKYDPRITAKYDIKALIGKGTFSKVVRVENRLTKQPYAIKIIESKEGREAFEAELAILRRVKCPYIIQLVEVFESVDKIYMVMELATGGDLFDKIMTKGPFSERDAVKVLKMVLEGVKYLHNLGITHRDLKPDNLLYYHPGTDSRLMITDFGLAHTRRSADDLLMNTICGTPEYIAPEMVARRRYTNAVDLWAVGVITYILLRGDFPFFDADRIRLYKKILKGNYNLSDEVWQEVSESGRDFVRGVLEVDPQARLTAVEALRHQWILANHSPKTRQASSPGGSWGRRSSSRSSHSSRSARSATSLRTDRRRVKPQELERLNQTGNSSISHPTRRAVYMS
ncbi:serine/threonine-protein kinase H1 homolog isoform X2 [Penaeus japonicus]|uniref:serine/threonine-protein kinase H1 homolog isoform X2 n=1 Tax=Penaeus japonicus TaxID=27405 RepID=UPI001C712C29|nr:serine/threonine-protein kinase H1 homolog isoform X2 [Penaeus japonicus]